MFQKAALTALLLASVSSRRQSHRRKAIRRGRRGWSYRFPLVAKASQLTVVLMAFAPLTFRTASTRAGRSHSSTAPE